MEYKDIIGKAHLTEVDWNILIETIYGFYVEVGTNHGGSACAAAQKSR